MRTKAVAGAKAVKDALKVTIRKAIQKKASGTESAKMGWHTKKIKGMLIAKDQMSKQQMVKVEKSIQLR